MARRSIGCLQYQTGAKPPSADCLLCRSSRACALGAGLGAGWIDRRCTGLKSQSLKIVGVRSENFAELGIAMNKGRFRQETARSADARDVGGGQMRIPSMSICKFFNPAAPASGDSKRRLSPSLRTGRPLADVKQNVRAFNRRRGHEVTTTAGHTEGVGQGKCAPSQTRHMDLELATLIAALRRRSSTEVNEAGVGRDLLLMGSMRSQSLSNKRDATNMHGDHERSQRCAIRTAAACQSWCVVLIYARTFGAITCRRLRQRLRTEAPDRISGGS